MQQRLLRDVFTTWSARVDARIEARASDTGDVFTTAPPDVPGSVVVEGTLAALTVWATGRSTAGVVAGDGSEPVAVAPRWQ